MSENNSHINNFDQSLKKRFEQGGITPPENAWEDLNAQFEQIEDDAFDNEIREKLNEGIEPPGDLWQNIDEATQEKSRKYRGVYWLFLGLLIVGLGTYLTVGVSSESEGNITASSEPQKSIVEIEKDNRPANKINKVINSSEPSEIENKRLINPLSISLEQEREFEEDKTQLKETNQSGSNSDAIKNKTESSAELNLGTRQKLINRKSVSQNLKGQDSETDLIDLGTKKSTSEKGAELVQNGIQKTQPSSDSLKASLENKSDELVTSKPLRTTVQNLDNKGETSSSLNTSSEINTDSLNSTQDSTLALNSSILDTNNFNSPDTTLDSNLAVISDTSKVKPSEREQKKKLKNDSTRKWMITAYAVPEYQYQRVTKNGSNNHFFDSLLTSNFTWLFEIGASYTIKNQFQIGFGFSASKFNYDYEKTVDGINNLPVIKASYPSGIVEINGLFGNTQSPDLIEIKMAPEGTDLNEFLFNKEITYNEKLVYTSINIPFDVKWVPGNKWIKPLIKLGGEFNIMTNSSSEVSITFLSETATTENHAQIASLNFSSSFGLGTQIDLINGLGITLLPSLNYQTSGFSKNSEFQFNPYSIRVYSGFFYKF